MRKTIVLLLALVGHSTFAVQEVSADFATTTGTQNLKSINVEIPVTSISSGSYELALSALFPISEKSTLGPSIGYLSQQGHYYSIQGQSVGISHNYYYNGIRSSGIYLSQRIGGYQYSYSSKNPTLDTSISIPNNSLYLAALVGKQWVFNNNLLLQAGVGIQYNTNNEVTETHHTFASSSKFQARASDLTIDGSIKLGYFY